MTMRQCWGCQKDIHETAPTCPHCGAIQPNTNRPLVTKDDFVEANLALDHARIKGVVSFLWWLFKLWVVFVIASVVIGVFLAIGPH